MVSITNINNGVNETTTVGAEIVIPIIYGYLGGYHTMPTEQMYCIQVNVILDVNFVDVVRNVGPTYSSSHGIDYQHQ